VAIRWGFLGAGFVASRAMAPAVHTARGAQLYAVASRDEQRSRSLEPLVVHSSYTDVLQDDAVDAVYISLANHQHVEWVTRALRAGKHVLCEKPLGVSASDVRDMYSIASNTGKILVEATWVRWHPRFRRLIELVGAGELGDVQHVESAFTSVSDMTENYRLHPEMGGGALLDVGCYQVHAWVAMFGSDVNVAIREVNRDIGPTGIDVTTRVTVDFNSYATGTSVSSFVLPATQELFIQGSVSRAHMLHGEAFTSWREATSLRVGEMEESFEPVDAFVEMTEQVSAYIADGSGWVFPQEDTQRVAQIVDDISAHPSNDIAAV
jgi:D-xylose 1-dehydrogenase (NADP+, D-xylono-1,5-lactone-forming)